MPSAASPPTACRATCSRTSRRSASRSASWTPATRASSIDVSVARGDLPPYDGPPEPADTPEWGSAVADQPDDAPVAGPNRLEPTP